MIVDKMWSWSPDSKVKVFLVILLDSSYDYGGLFMTLIVWGIGMK